MLLGIALLFIFLYLPSEYYVFAVKSILFAGSKPLTPDLDLI